MAGRPWLGVVMVAVGLTARVRADAPANGATAAEAELRKLITERKTAASRGDGATWGSSVSDDSLWITEDAAVKSKAQVSKENAANVAGTIRTDLLDFQVLLAGETAVATYRFEERSDHNGKTVTERYRFLETYVRRGGQWQLLAVSETPTPSVPEPSVAVKVDRRVLDRYVGTYQWLPGQTLTISREGDLLMSQATGETSRQPLFAESETTFFDQGQSWRWVFAKDKTGKITQLIFRKHGNDYELPRVK